MRLVPVAVLSLFAAAACADEFDAVLDGEVSGRPDSFEEVSSELEKAAKDKLDHPDWERRFKDALRVTYGQARPDWSHESTGAYEKWVRQCHAQGRVAFEKLIPEAENGYQRRKTYEELVKITEGDVRDKYCLLLIDDPEVDRKEKSRLRALVVDNLSFDPHCWSWRYDARHINFKSEEEIRTREERFFTMCRAEIEAHAGERDVVARRCDQMGSAHAALGDYVAAEPWYRRSVETKAGSGNMFALAECLFAAGKTNETVKLLEEQQRRFSGPWKRTAHCFATTGLGAEALRFLKGTTLDGLKLPLGSLYRAYPTPKRVTYTEDFVPTHGLKIVAKGVSRDDARLRFFEKKMRGRGFSFSDDAPYEVAVDRSDAAPVDKPEGYALTVTKDGAKIAARDLQGVLWGLVSLIQVSCNTNASLRVCEMEDWPDLARRGYFGGFWPDCTEFTVMCKMNFVAHQSHPETYVFHSPLRTYLNAALAKEFHDLGLTLHYGISSLTHAPQLPMCDRRTFDFRLSEFRHYARMHAGIYWPYDDVRYPVIEQDLKAFGPKAGTKMDARHINEIYQATVEEFPAFSLIFCPPFYWGPDSTAWRSYPEDLYEYLPSVRTNLDPRVHVVWTGPRVKGWKKEKRKVKWFADLIGRKPLVFQNGMGAHNYLNYTVDVTDWNRWMHYKGFYDDISAYLKNSATPCDCPQLMTLADCLWNDDGYDAERSVREGVTQLMGDGVYAALKRGAGALAYFDKYEYGSVYTDKTCRHENPALKEEKESDLAAKVALGRSCYEAAKRLAPREMAMYGSYGRGVGFAEAVHEAFRKRYGSKRERPPDKRDAVTLDEDEIPSDNKGGIEDSLPEL